MSRYHFRFSIVYFLFFSLSIISANGQGFQAGLAGGVAATQISGDQLSGFNKAGIVAGGFVSTQLSPKFDVQMEILYFQKGSRKNADPEKEDYVTYLLRLNYFEVPLLVEWKYSKRFVLEAGPTFGALLSSYEEDETGQLVIQYPFHKFELGALAGLNIILGKGFIFNARYEGSIIPVREHVSGETYRFNKGQYNTEIVFSFRYKFKGKTKSTE